MHGRSKFERLIDIFIFSEYIDSHIEKKHIKYYQWENDLHLNQVKKSDNFRQFVFIFVDLLKNLLQ